MNHDDSNYFEYYGFLRFLQDNATTTTEEDDETLSSSEILRTTCKIYGSIFLVLFVLYLLVRPKFPGVYNIKKNYPNLKADVASDSFGAISWMWKVFFVSGEDIVEQCGMDAATTIRLFDLGVKLSIVGVLCSIFLFPAYKYGDTLESIGNVTDPMEALSLSNVPSGSNKAIATTMAAYVLFGAAMFLIARDLQWFQNHRRTFLSKSTPQNYSVYMSGLPDEMQSDAAVKYHFQQQNVHVQEARVALKIPNLEGKVAERDKLVPKFEHAINVKIVKGEEPMHKTKMCGGEKVESIPTYDKELQELNTEIGDSIHAVSAMQQERDADFDAREPKNDDEESPKSPASVVEPYEGKDPPSSETEEEVPSTDNLDTAVEEPKMEGHQDDEQETAAEDPNANSNRPSLMASIATSIKNAMASEDGAPREAAFVSFTDLTSANLAMQAVHHHQPWVCNVQPAPAPDQVEWKNAGTPNKSKQIGELISFTLTALLCVFWTIPVAFVASLSNVEALTELLPWLQPIVDNNPWFGALLAQLAPLILVVFVSLLPVFLLAFVGLEKHIAIATYQHPSLFNKVAWFTIIQTFFVSTISGSITSELEKISQDTTYAVQLLATALPAQAGYFIQLILVQNFLGIGTELLRVSALVSKLLRRILGKLLGFDLTEKEKNSALFGQRPFSDPSEWYFGRALGGEATLIFMVLFVYGCMSPITCYFTLFIFLLLAMAYRNQFIYIYPIANDSGGRLYENFVKVCITSMIIAEVVLIAVLALKQSPIAVGLFVPLIVITILFSVYLNKQHYHVTRFLPTEDCGKQDRWNEQKVMDVDFLKEAYLQPAMKTKTILPENYDEIQHGMVKAMSSPVDGNEDDKEEELSV